MAKNIQIFFVYNTNRTEIDNASESILYFYPEWVSDEQKGALCGQIIGTIQCMKNLFSKPNIISLQNGKFLVIESRSLYFVLGSDKNAPSSFLQTIAKNLYSSLNFFHLNIEILETLSSSKAILQKLHDIFDGYLKLLNFSGKIYSQSPLTKSSNDIFIEAMQILECCKSIKYVLGGAIIYRNRLIATQLCTLLTQMVQLTGSGSVQCPSIRNKLSFSLPPEVQLYEVFIPNKEYLRLIKESKENNLFEKLSSGSIKKKLRKSTQKNNDNSVLSAMKREQSLIFTSVPEEESSLPTLKQSHTFSTKKNRPRFLNLESASTNPKKGLKQFNVLPHSSSQIIVCNTPLQEQKKIVHFNPLLICNNEILDNKKMILKEEKPSNDKKKNCTTNSVPFERKSIYYKTLADPTFPLFKLNGKLMSFHLFEETRAAQDPQVCRRSCEDLENISGYARKSRNGGKLGNSSKIPMLPKSNSFFNNYKFKPAKETANSILQRPNFDFLYKRSRKTSDTTKTTSETVQKCVLFLWQRQDIVLTVLLSREACDEKDPFLSLEDMCTRHLSKLECKMRNNIHFQNVQQEKENKFVVLDSCLNFGGQDTLWNGGADDDDWRNLNYFNQELNSLNLSEVLIRCDENVLYGYHCGPNKIFYSETSSICNGGLPLPTDPLGILQIKAKRRLERDCAFILL